MWSGWALVSVLALVCSPITNAAFFYVPDYRTDLIDVLPPASITPRDSSSFRLVRRFRSAVHLSKRTSEHAIRDSLGGSWHGSHGKRAPGVLSPVQPGNKDSLGIWQDGTDYSYFIEVELGSNGKKLFMLIDTGASASWVMGSGCTTTACQSHRTFGPADSTTYQDAAGTFSFDYGTGNVSGTDATDTVAIASLKIDLTFGVADHTSDEFSHYPIDGILGLSMKFGDKPTFIQALVASRQLKQNMFGISLARAAEGANDGVITFGEPDSSAYQGSIEYTGLAKSTNGNWAIPMDNMGLGNSQTGITGRNAFIDTGTSYIFAPKDDVAKFHALVPGSATTNGEAYTVPCSTKDDATFTFSGNTYKVSAQDWVGPVVNGSCTSNIYGKAWVPDAWLLGDTFLKNVYAVFDIDKSRIGFAEQFPASGKSNVTSATSAGNPSVVATEKQNSAGVHVGLKLSHFRSIVAAFLLMASL